MHSSIPTIRPSCLLISLAFLAAGCATEFVEVQQEDRAAVSRAAKIAVVHYHTPGTVFSTPASATGKEGLLPMGIAKWTKSDKAPEWWEVMSQYRVPDPTETLKARFMQSLQRDAGLNNLEPVRASLKLPVNHEGSAYKGKYAADYVLVVSTAGTHVMYEAFDWKTYNFSYAGRAKLIRSGDGQVIWKGLCSVSGHKDNAYKLTIYDIIGTSGKVSTIYDKATAECARQLVDQYLGKKVQL